MTAALVYTALTTEKAVGGIGGRLEDLPEYAREAILLLSYSFVPPGTTNTAPRAAGLLLAGAIVLAAVWRYRKTRDREVGFWLLVVGGSVVTIASAYAVTLGAFLEPLRPGLFNRGNLFAAFGFAALVYALAMTAAQLFGGRRHIARAVGAAAVVLIAVGYVVRARDDVADWDRAASLQEFALDATSDAAAAVPRGSTLFTFGHPGGPPRRRHPGLLRRLGSRRRAGDEGERSLAPCVSGLRLGESRPGFAPGRDHVHPLRQRRRRRTTDRRTSSMYRRGTCGRSPPWTTAPMPCECSARGRSTSSLTRPECR